LRPLPGGVYRVNQRMLADCRAAARGEHPSNLGAMLAHGLGEPAGRPSYVVDPVSVDELAPLARYSGLPELPRQSLLHALNIKAAARWTATELGRTLDEVNLVVAHLGSGISVAPCERGRLVDVNNANDEGPFGPERAGGLPATGLVKLAFSGVHSEASLLRRLVRDGGVKAYLGTSDVEGQVLPRIAAGDAEAAEVMAALAYQVAKAIGAMAAVLAGRVDAVVITGGLAKAGFLVDEISRRVGFLGKVLVYPGEDELLAMAQGVLRVLRGEERAKEY